jgi:hypothetical protein
MYATFFAKTEEWGNFRENFNKSESFRENELRKLSIMKEKKNIIVLTLRQY